MSERTVFKFAQIAGLLVIGGLAIKVLVTYPAIFLLGLGIAILCGCAALKSGAF